MPATYTFDVFSSLYGYGSYGEGGDWGGYWGKQGPELLGHRFALFGAEQRMVFGADTFRQFVEMLGAVDKESGATPGSPGCGTCPRRWCRAPWKNRSTGRTLPSRVGTLSISSPCSRRSPRCRCGRTAACR